MDGYNTYLFSILVPCASSILVPCASYLFGMQQVLHVQFYVLTSDKINISEAAGG